MQEIADRIKLNQQELDKLRNLKFQKPDIQTLSSNNPDIVKDAQKTIIDKFIELKKDISAKNPSKKLAKEFRKLEKSIKHSVPQSLEILKKEEEILVQKLEIQRLLK
jgi:hypothetical protein